MQDINEDTEWNDALRKMGIIPEKPKVDPNELLDLAVEARDAYEAEKLSKLDLDELDELEDLEDDDVLESYRRQRLSELAAKEKTEKYGEGVVAISKPDYKRQVTDASETCWVVVHLYRDSILECKLVNKLLNEVSAENKSTKFVKIVGSECIPNYPDSNLPTLLIYKDGDVRAQLVGLSSLGGLNTKKKGLEGYLRSIGAIESKPSKTNESDDTGDDDDDDDDDEEDSSYRKPTYISLA